MSSLCPNVLLLLHSLFNEYSERQINTDRTVARRWRRKEREEELERKGRGWKVKRKGRSSSVVIIQA